MSDSSLSSSPTTPVPSQDAIDASCRLPLLAIFPGAVLWLVVAAVAAMFASISFHKPGLFGDCAWMSYGRILPVAKTSLLYGFCLPTGYGLAFWMAARLGRTTLAFAIETGIAAKLWNLGVFIGVFGILCGAGTGYEGFEMPRYAMIILMAASILWGVAGLSTIHRRTEAGLYPSHWFIIAGVLWFPWILSTATMLLGVMPVRGVAQSVVHWWYLGNLQVVVLGLFGLAAVFYFMPKLASRDLHSENLARFTFFTLLLFGSWVGMPVGGPLPAWMGVLSSVAALCLVVSVVSVVENVRHSCSFNAPDPEARFFSFAIPMLMLAVVIGACAALPPLAPRVDFTLVRSGQIQLLVAGFFCMVAMGGIYHVLPRVVAAKWPFPSLIRAHLWLATLGVLLIAGAYLIGGWQQGAKLAQADIKFVDVARGVLMPIRIATMGECFWTLGCLFFAANAGVLVARTMFATMKPFVADITVTRPLPEVKP
jgi:cytochrome c oxidase cbb3-type subunit 1